MASLDNPFGTSRLADALFAILGGLALVIGGFIAFAVLYSGITRGEVDTARIVVAVAAGFGMLSGAGILAFLWRSRHSRRELRDAQTQWDREKAKRGPRPTEYR